MKLKSIAYAVVLIGTACLLATTMATVLTGAFGVMGSGIAGGVIASAVAYLGYMKTKDTEWGFNFNQLFKPKAVLVAEPQEA